MNFTRRWARQALKKDIGAKKFCVPRKRKGWRMNRPALTAATRVAWGLTCAATILYSIREAEWRIDLSQYHIGLMDEQMVPLRRDTKV
jgi:hypothetical protein